MTVEESQKTFPFRAKLARLIGTKVLDFKGKGRLIQSIWNPHKLKDMEFAIPFFGKTYRGNTTDFIDWNVWVYGAYEFSYVNLWMDIFNQIHPGPKLFFDVGANIGHHSLAMSSVADKVYSFEPHPMIFKELTRRLVTAKVSHVDCTNVALGKNHDDVTLYSRDFSKSANRGTSSLLESHNKNEIAQTFTVKQTRLDDISFEEENHDPFILLKIDVEGAEKNVIEGGLNFIKKFKPVIHLETESQDPISLLLNEGYSGYSVVNYYHHLKLFPMDPSRYSNHILTPKGLVLDLAKP